jgi:hypothetical protein
LSEPKQGWQDNNMGQAKNVVWVPVFNEVDVGKVDGRIYAKDDHAMINVAIWILYNISVDSGSW